MASDTTFYRACRRCGVMMAFPPPPVDTAFLTNPDVDVPEELREWRMLRDKGAEPAHDTGMCPREIEEAAAAAIGKHSYTVKLLVLRDDDPDPVGGVSLTHEGTTFAEAAEHMVEPLGEKWNQLVKMAPTIDSDLSA